MRVVIEADNSRVQYKLCLILGGIKMSILESMEATPDTRQIIDSELSRLCSAVVLIALDKKTVEATILELYKRFDGKAIDILSDKITKSFLEFCSSIVKFLIELYLDKIQQLNLVERKFAIQKYDRVKITYTNSSNCVLVLGDDK